MVWPSWHVIMTEKGADLPQPKIPLEILTAAALRWMRKAPRSPEPARRWPTFLSNHREAIAAMDFLPFRR
jgi:hypothetical protein